MIVLNTPQKAQKQLAENMKALRLEKGYTQQGLSERSGVSLAVIRKFEQKSAVSLESFLKLAMVLGCLDSIVEASTPKQKEFSSIDEVLEKKEPKKPQRGWRK